MDFTTAADGFFQYLEYEKGCTAATSSAYGADLRRCIAFLGEVGVALEVEAITQQVVRKYLVWMGERGLAPSTVRRRIAALSSLYRYLVSTGALVHNPCLGLALPKKRRRLPAVLTVEEAKRLLAASEDHPNVRTSLPQSGDHRGAVVLRPAAGGGPRAAGRRCGPEVGVAQGAEWEGRQGPADPDGARRGGDHR